MKKFLNAIDHTLLTITDDLFEKAVQSYETVMVSDIKFETVNGTLMIKGKVEDGSDTFDTLVSISEEKIIYRVCMCSNKGIELCVHQVLLLLKAKKIILKDECGKNDYIKSVLVGLQTQARQGHADAYGLFEDTSEGKVYIKPLKKSKKEYIPIEMEMYDFFCSAAGDSRENDIKSFTYPDIKTGKLFLRAFRSMREKMTEIFYDNKIISFGADVNLYCIIDKDSNNNYGLRFELKSDGESMATEKVLSSLQDCVVIDEKKQFRIVDVNYPFDISKLVLQTVQNIPYDEITNDYIHKLMGTGIKFLSNTPDIKVLQGPQFYELYIFRIDQMFKFNLKISCEGVSYTFRQAGQMIRDTVCEQEVVLSLLKAGVKLDKNGEASMGPSKFVKFLNEGILEIDRRIRVLYAQDIKVISTPRVTVSGTRKTDWFELSICIEDQDIKQYYEEIKKSGYIVLKDGGIVEVPPKVRKLVESIERNGGKVPFYKLFDFKQEADGEVKEYLERFERFESVSSDVFVLKLPLREYQRKAVDYLRFLYGYGLNAILADDMGLGKTVQTIALLGGKKSSKKDLILCPKSVLYNWAAEIDKFSDMSWHIYGQGKNISPDTRIIIATYSALRNSEELQSKEYNFIVLDEAQYIKNSWTQTSETVKSLSAEHKLALTGTPIENSIMDIYSIFDFLMPDFLGEEKKFLQTCVQQEGKNHIASKIKPFVIRRTKEEVLKDLPQKNIQSVYVSMEEKQEEIYADLLAQARYKLKSINNESEIKFSALELLLRLRQAACHPKLLFQWYQNSSGKFEEFKSITNTVIQSGHKILVFSQFVSMLDIMERYLDEAKIKYFTITGSTENRAEVCEKFNNSNNTRILLCSLRAGGTGLNITGADYVLHYDPWWNRAVENQATDRAYRIGQTKNVFVYRFITKNSVEEKIEKLQNSKQEISNAFVPENNILQNLTKQEITELFED
jgi:superfamily II DNA or RNA helicase